MDRRCQCLADGFLLLLWLVRWSETLFRTISERLLTTLTVSGVFVCTVLGHSVHLECIAGIR